LPRRSHVDDNEPSLPPIETVSTNIAPLLGKEEVMKARTPFGLVIQRGLGVSATTAKTRAMRTLMAMVLAILSGITLATNAVAGCTIFPDRRTSASSVTTGHATSPTTSSP
jgi:hypothetical protein